MKHRTLYEYLSDRMLIQAWNDGRIGLGIQYEPNFVIHWKAVRFRFGSLGLRIGWHLEGGEQE